MSERSGEQEILDLEHLRLVCCEDSDFEREIIGDFLAQAVPYVARLEAAVTAGDVTELKFVAHALTGSSRSLGAAAFGQACARLDALAKSGDLTDAPSALARAREEWERLRDRLEAHRARPAA